MSPRQFARYGRGGQRPAVRALWPALLLALLLAWPAAVRPAAAGEPKSIPFVFTDVEGRSIRLADLRGKWVLVNFWATWCPLCKASVPALNELNERDDVAVIGICLDYGDKPGTVPQAIGQFGMRFHAQVAGGSRGKPDSPHRQVGPVDFFPTSYLYDPEGEIAMFIPGQLRGAKVLAYMDKWQAGRTGMAAKTQPGAKLATALKQRLGGRGGQLYEAWRRLLETDAAETEPARLDRVNHFFNQRIQVANDRQVWGRDDYWATPGELLVAGRGDSEDFAIAKYFTLLAMQVPHERLRLVYTRPGAGIRQAADDVHVVLAYYPPAGGEPLILDHRVAEVTPASRRPDLRPVYTFNSQGGWGDMAATGGAGDNNRLAIWEDTLRRTRLEGFE